MENIISKFSKVKRTSNGYMASCPLHDDSTPSLSITQKEDKILLYCFSSGCKAEDIIKEVGLDISDLFLGEDNMNEAVVLAKVKTEEKRKYNSISDIISNFKNLESVYEYNYPNEDNCQIQIRYVKNEKKQFATYHKEDNVWYEGKLLGLSPLYNINNVLKAKSVLIVEGEKLVNLLSDYGITACTSIGGSLNPQNTDWSSLMNIQSVVMWRDYNEPGLKYQNSIVNILSNLGIKLRIVEVDKLGLEIDDDLEQFIDKQKGTKEEIRDRIIECIPKMEDNKPISYLRNHLAKVKKGEIKNWEVPFFPLLTKQARAFKPGTQTVIVSAGGVGKSLFIGRTSDELVLSGNAKVKRLHLESSTAFYLTRSLSQQSSCIDVMNEEFHYENPEISDKLVNQYEDVLNIIGESITTSDSGAKKSLTQWNADGVARWMTNNADCDILIIDPVSMVLDTGSPWLTSTMLTKHAEDLMSKNPHLAIIWVQHTAESSSSGNVGAISGGKAWNRYSSSVLEMVAFEEPEHYEIMMSDGDVQITEVETYIKVKKARSGAALNWKIAIKLDKEDLTYKEIGRMLKKSK